MSKTILVCGYGPGISSATARTFGAQGFSVAIAARNAGKLSMAVGALQSAGITAAPFPADLGDPQAVKSLVADVRARLGPITVIHWNAYAATAGDLTLAPLSQLHQALDVGVGGLVVAVQEALSDLKSQRGAAVLVTGGGLYADDPKVNAMAVEWNAMGLALVKTAQHKLVGLLGEKLNAHGIYVGEVIVLSRVKGTAFDSGNATLEPAAVAARFWDLYAKRSERSVSVG